MLQGGDTFVVGISKNVAINAVVSDAELASLIAVRYMEYLKAVGEDWETMSLQQPQQDKFVGAAIDPDDSIQCSVE